MEVILLVKIIFKVILLEQHRCYTHHVWRVYVDEKVYFLPHIVLNSLLIQEVRETNRLVFRKLFWWT